MDEPTKIYNDLAGWRGRKKRAVVAKEEVSEGAIGCRHSEELGAGENGQEAIGGESSGVAGRLVMVRVVRICANPRMVLCVYQEGGLGRRVLVRVGRNTNFRRGMELEAVRGLSETEPWSYAGRLPRFAGRW